MDHSLDIVCRDQRFGLEEGVIAEWCRIEFAMSELVRHLKPDANTCSHTPIDFPSKYLYRQTFSNKKKAQQAARKSLWAFHVLFGYCSYLLASTKVPHFSQRQYKTLYENPVTMDNIAFGNGHKGSHIFLKLLWSSLGEVRQARNFVGVVVTYEESYHYQSVLDMHKYGVPIYVRWSRSSRLKSYCWLNESDLLRQWRPSPDSFDAVGQPQPPVASGSGTSPIHQPQRSVASGSGASLTHQSPPLPPPEVLNECDAKFPLHYVKKRKASISSTVEKPHSWLDREQSKRSFAAPGKHGCAVYQFTATDVVDEGTGKEVQKWQRVLLTRASAQLLWNGVKRRNLWYGSHPSSHYCSERGTQVRLRA